MSRLTLTAAVALALGLPALAQDTQAPAPSAPFEMPKADAPPPAAARPFELPEAEDGVLDNFFSDLIGRAQPHLEGLAQDLGGLMEDYQPALQELSRLIDDIGNYELPPERLPNGDIIIRRKADAPPPPPLENLRPPEGTPPAEPSPAEPPPDAPGQIEL